MYLNLLRHGFSGVLEWRKFLPASKKEFWPEGEEICGILLCASHHRRLAEVKSIHGEKEVDLIITIKLNVVPFLLIYSRSSKWGSQLDFRKQIAVLYDVYCDPSKNVES